MINIVHDNLPHSNVWFAPKKYEQAFSTQHNKPLPWFLHLGHELAFFDSADDLDSFIYPVVMQEPYILARSLILNHNPFGFWSYVSDDVIKGLREKRGWVIIDLCIEPISRHDFDCILTSLSDCSLFPNDRILINAVSPHLVDNKRVFNHPSHLEVGCLARELPGSKIKYLPCVCDPFRYKEIEYSHRRFLLLNNHMDYPVAKAFAKYASENHECFLDSSSEVLGEPDVKTVVRLPQALYATDFNVVLEAYVDFDVIDYPFCTEKIFRNIKYKKPFIVMGQRYTLASLRKLGYKTFTPLIDESYDECAYTKERVAAVIKELEGLKSMSNNEWVSFLDKCKPILEHNYDNLLKRVKQTNDWLEGLKNL